MTDGGLLRQEVEALHPRVLDGAARGPELRRYCEVLGGHCRKVAFFALARARVAERDELAADIVQEVWRRLWEDDARRLRAWRPERGGLLGYVRVVTGSVVADLLRTRKTNPASEVPTDSDVLQAVATLSHSADVERLEVRDVLARLDSAVRRRLSPEDATLFDLRLIREEPLADVARALEITEAATYQRINRLRGRLKGLLSELLCEDGAPSRTFLMILLTLLPWLRVWRRRWPHRPAGL